MQFDKHTSIYLQIADYIRDRIRDGSWPDGERISSIRDMAMLLEVNPNTVTRTYTLLQDEGTIENQRGIGYFVAPGAVENLKQMKKRAFLDETLPRLFTEMTALGLGINDIIARYNNAKHDNAEYDKGKLQHVAGERNNDNAQDKQ
ncbi:GntR family transcriptional regulator [Parasphaerochaeta coccoides]|uniref:Transcriptional regulator, GntR family n=1 Tax=Parasphaerochaeta coccoides (strain ATCC BAA-1237 / DSM 17374 / SPN1) TaxID=760011 RepID=F4GJR5_PARC1|nr:GntR family transcriptional regulator [Parasphaerochaeta coccoides]AEC02812.1 transcriptional regulator, GntR family [Parasphaerochaeta coccoides DSM 17374]